MPLLYFNPESNIYCNIMLIDCYGIGREAIKVAIIRNVTIRNIFPYIREIVYISINNITAFNQDHTLALLSTLYLLFCYVNSDVFHYAI
ncbi:hypothetical protein SAMN05428949_6560 [Chitinophaga sp. YR627]|nr:hypothetical protein SAMN05428949_6560 [Chitinophaga sp. YR627]